MGELRTAIGREIAAANARGESYDAVLTAVATTLGCMIAAGSPNRAFRLDRVRASMAVIAAIIDSPLPDPAQAVGEKG